mgnify:FL=1
MSIQLHISPNIILSIATLYNDVNRIFMEYIDNSLDSAESYFDPNTNSYSKPIEIILKIKGENHKTGRVVILDNCVGITNFTKVVESVGNSDKKTNQWTNGQFGYGVYSFIAACSSLEITSKEQNKQALYLPINRTQFKVEKQEDVKFPNPKQSRFDLLSGTKIELGNFDKNSWKQIDIDDLKKEIEKHFELLLDRKNLQIKMIDQSGKEYACAPFNYEQYEGDVYEDNLDKLNYVSGKKSPTTTVRTLRKPIRVFIKITNGRTINKNPIFIAKGRRIGEIKNVSSFRSKHKSDLWGHPNVTGFIDVSDFLEPTIARNDFKNNEQSKALYGKLVEIEPLILDVVKEINKKSEERHYKELEDILNQALSNLAKLDYMNFRTDFLSGNKVNLEAGGSGQRLEDGKGKKDREGGGNGEDEYIFGENEGVGIGVGGDSGKIPGGNNEGESAKSKEAENPFEDTGFKGDEKKKSGFNIRIVDIEPDVDSNTNKQLRSNVVGGEIRIFKLHPDFNLRVDESRKGEKRISQRLITYLAGEITVHYKDKFHNRKGQPDYNKNLFVDLVEFVYQLENYLKDLAGKSLSELN